MTPEKLTEDQLVLAQLVYHEVGHAVVALHFGWNVTSISREPDADSHGRMTFSRGNYPAEQDALVTIAGLINTLAAGFGVARSSRGCGGDLKHLATLDHSLTDTELWTAALDILRSHQTAVDALAQDLTRTPTLTGLQFARYFAC